MKPDESLLDALREANKAAPPASTWRHRSGGLYTVTCVALEESTLTPVVVYQGDETGLRWTRPVEQFLDGRFTREA